MQNDIYNEFTDAINCFLVNHPEAEFGPAHVLFSDLNVDIPYINGCLASLTKALSKKLYELDNCNEFDAQLLYEIDSLSAQILFLFDWKFYIMKHESND